MQEEITQGVVSLSVEAVIPSPKDLALKELTDSL